MEYWWIARMNHDSLHSHNKMNNNDNHILLKKWNGELKKFRESEMLQYKLSRQLKMKAGFFSFMQIILFMVWSISCLVIIWPIGKF